RTPGDRPGGAAPRARRAHLHAPRGRGRPRPRAERGPVGVMTIVVFGLSMTSSWGNGHASTYRSLLRALARRGHDVLFLERDVPWYADNRDLRQPAYARVELYTSTDEIAGRFRDAVRDADLVIIGSYVPDGV